MVRVLMMNERMSVFQVRKVKAHQAEQRGRMKDEGWEGGVRAESWESRWECREHQGRRGQRRKEQLSWVTLGWQTRMPSGARQVIEVNEEAGGDHREERPMED